MYAYIQGWPGSLVGFLRFMASLVQHPCGTERYGIGWGAVIGVGPGTFNRLARIQRASSRSLVMTGLALVP